jgi:hypothetical protein
MENCEKIGFFIGAELWKIERASQKCHSGIAGDRRREVRLGGNESGKI